jgi:hypothetical protein
MTRRRAPWAAVTAIAAVAMTAAHQDPPQSQPVFRTRTTAVSLDVSVKRGNRPVAGLTAADFEVTDNGVPQTVEQAFTGVVPIDVTLVIDASARTAPIYDGIRRSAQRILDLLRRDDRARVLISESISYALLPLQAVDDGLVLPEQPMPGARSRIQDALLAALVTPRDPDRRRLVVTITGGWDSKSVTSVHLLDRVARRSDTVLHILAVRPDLTIDLQARKPPSRTWSNIDGFIRDVPTEQELKLFEGLPVLTGGTYQGPGSWGPFARNVNVVDAIRQAIEEFRQSYVIQYTPRDVAPGGWHDVAVRVKGVDPRGVRTRAGYTDVLQ